MHSFSTANTRSCVGARFLGVGIDGTVGVYSDGEHRPERFGVNIGGDETAFIQAAINQASWSQNNTITFDRRRYLFSNLYSYYHPELNPGYNPDPFRHGRILFQGKGRLDLAHLRSYSPEYGTVLESTILSGNALSVSSTALGHDALPCPNRQVLFRDISLVGNTDGYVLEMAGAPESSLNNTAVLQRNKNGGGVDFHSSWFGSVHNSAILGSADGSSSSGIGLRLGTEVPAGVFVLNDSSLVDSFHDGIKTTGNMWSGLSIENSAIQNCRNANINISSRVLQLLLSGVYFEGSRKYDILGELEGIGALKISGAYFYNGSQTESLVGESNIYLKSVGKVDINCSFGHRPFKPFLKIDTLRNGKLAGCVSNCEFIHDNPSALETVVDLFTGQIPELDNVTYTGQHLGIDSARSSGLRLYDPEKSVAYSDSQSGIRSTIGLSIGRPHIVTGQGAFFNYDTSKTFIDITNTTAISSALPGSATIPNGTVYGLKNNQNSAGNITVLDNSSAVIDVLAPGKIGWYVREKLANNTYIKII